MRASVYHNTIHRAPIHSRRRGAGVLLATAVKSAVNKPARAGRDAHRLFFFFFNIVMIIFIYIFHFWRRIRLLLPIDPAAIQMETSRIAFSL